MGYYCPYCGNYLNNSDKICPSCGRQLDIQVQQAEQPVQEEQPQQNVQRQQPQQAGWNNQMQQNAQRQQAGWSNQPQQMQQPTMQRQPQPMQQPVLQSPQKPEPTMKWFKFVIWLQLFISAIVAAVNAALLLTGYNYGDMTKLVGTDFSSAFHEYLENAGQMKELVYAYYPSLQMVDFGCGIAYAVVALLAIIVRFRLSGMKKNGPSLYIFYLVLEVLVSLAYTGLVINAIQALTIDVSFIASMASIGWSIILIFLNVTYFKKRKHMFCK